MERSYYKKYIHNNIRYPKEYLDYIYNSDKKLQFEIKKPNINESKLNNYIYEYYNILKKMGYKDFSLYSFTLLSVFFKTKNREDLFFKMLNDTKILIENNTTYNIGKREGFKKVITKDECAFYTPKVVSSINYQKKKVNLTNSYVIIGTQCKYDYLTLFDQITHEIRHAMVDNNCVKKFTGKKSFDLKYGLVKHIYNDQTFTRCNVVFDELFNTFFTEKIVSEVLNYSYYSIENDEIKQFFKKIETKNKYVSSTYIELRLLCYPLLSNKELVNLVDEVSFNGKITNLYEYFNIRNVDFKKYNEKLDNYNSNINYIKEKSLLLKR